jgi:predicted DNA-binding transcriptional regulator AlpA
MQNVTFADGGKLLTKKEVAALLKVSTRTINRMVSTGELPKPLKRGAAQGRKLDKRPCLWFQSDAMAYIEKMAAASR